MTYNPDHQPSDKELESRVVCDLCLEENLTQDVHIQSCATCNEPYCVHYASVIDATNCIRCLSDISVTTESVVQTKIFESPKTGETVTKKKTFTRINIGGLHWLFAQRKIPMLTDAELECAIEYHFNYLRSMINEREQRFNKKIHRNAGKQYKITSPVGDATTTTVTTTVKKSRTISGTKQPVKVQAMDMDQIAQMIKMLGLTPEQVRAMVNKK